MPAITLKNIPTNLYKSLKESAKIHHRSLNGEAIACLEKSVGATKLNPKDTLDRIIRIRNQESTLKLTEKILKEAKETGRP